VFGSTSDMFLTSRTVSGTIYHSQLPKVRNLKEGMAWLKILDNLIMENCKAAGPPESKTLAHALH